MNYFLLLLEYIFRWVILLLLKYNFIKVIVLLLEYNISVLFTPLPISLPVGWGGGHHWAADGLKASDPSSSHTHTHTLKHITDPSSSHTHTHTHSNRKFRLI